MIYIIFTVILIVFFTFFYTTIQFNTVEYSKNLQANGGFISGIRAGKPTSDYLGRTLNRLVMPGAIALSILAILPTILTMVSKLPFNYGGTSIIIVVGVKQKKLLLLITFHIFQLEISLEKILKIIQNLEKKQSHIWTKVF